MTIVNAETQTRLKGRHTSSVKIVGPSIRQTSVWFFLRNSNSLGNISNLMTMSLRKKLGILIFGAALAFSITSTVHASTLLSLRAAFDEDRTQSNVLLITYGTDGEKNEGERGVINTSSLLRMNNAAIKQLFKDYWELRTNDGFSRKQFYLLCTVIYKDRTLIQGILNRLSNISGEKYRAKILDQELERNKERMKEVNKQFFEALKSEQNVRELGNIVHKKDRIIILKLFLRSWRKTPNVGPGGTVRINP